MASGETEPTEQMLSLSYSRERETAMSSSMVKGVEFVIGWIGAAMRREDGGREVGSAEGGSGGEESFAGWFGTHPVARRRGWGTRIS